MADKTTTLKTKTNDNVYPNIIGDNRDNAIADSSQIKHTLTAEHKINLRLDNNVNNLINNSLQKPAGLTKTELVGVGTNGQENIEIGDNLTLANGKLSATGGSSGGEGGISVIELTDKNGTIASTQLSEINANPQNFAFKYNGKILLFTSADSATYQYCNNTTSSSDNNVMTTSTLLTITSSTGVYTIAENVHNVVANSIHPANGGDLTNIQVGSKVYSIPSGGEGIKVVGVTNKWVTSGSSGSYYWFSDEPKSNTAYEIGRLFRVKYQHTVPEGSLKQSQILVPTAVCGDMISNIESGDVVIIPTNVRAQNLTISSTDNKTYKVYATMLAEYVVIKAGTTGTISYDMTHNLSATYQYNIYTLA